MKKFTKYLISVILILYLTICVILYFAQEKLIFFPEKLSKKYKFEFPQKFDEINIKVDDDTKLNCILFKADTSKGLIFYLHGNGGSARTWGEVAQPFTFMHYDVLMIDYRGYGKSEGSIQSKDQLFKDIQVVYSDMISKYNEDHIIILGYSIGTGPAAYLASNNHPKLLILQAPYFSLADMMHHYYPILPTFILKYNFETNEYIRKCKNPIVIFHGDQDEVIYYNSSVKLKKYLKPEDKLIILPGQGHNGMTFNPDYLSEIEKLLRD